MIEFLLNEVPRSLGQICPNTTVLQYLREHERKTGTKEGCASGDCGACTVVIGEVVDDRVKYISINSCIALIGSLHGKQLVTVEDLEQEKLHPVQQAMVDKHGSQCGFCTPGFVMSLFALYQNTQDFDNHDCEQYLAGNLCRCTGYQPIVNAAQSFNGAIRQDQFFDNMKNTVSSLSALQAKHTTASLNFNGKQFYWPRSVEDLSRLMFENPEARLVAGSTDLALEVTQQGKDIGALIYLGAIEELSQIEISSDHIRIGSAVTYESALPVLHEHYPDFAKMVLRLGSKQIRNVATFGGNIGNASPIGDTPPCFIALGATLILTKGKQSRSINIEDFFVDYKKTCLQDGEYISSIEMPRISDNQFLKVYKISKRIDDDISAVLAAFCITLVSQEGGRYVGDARLAYGGMAGVPKRATNAEKALVGQPWNESSIAHAMKAMESDFQPMSDVRASAGYREQVAKNLLYKCYLDSVDEQNLEGFDAIDVRGLVG